MTSPVSPVNPITVGAVLTSQVLAVQVGVMACMIPPGSFKPSGTVATRTSIIIFVFGGEVMVIVRREGALICTRNI